MIKAEILNMKTDLLQIGLMPSGEERVRALSDWFNHNIQLLSAQMSISTEQIERHNSGLIEFETESLFQKVGMELLRAKKEVTVFEEIPADNTHWQHWERRWRMELYILGKKTRNQSQTQERADWLLSHRETKKEGV